MYEVITISTLDGDVTNIVKTNADGSKTVFLENLESIEYQEYLNYLNKDAVEVTPDNR